MNNMCAKKDNYFETLTWIEDTIDACNTLDDEMNARQIMRKFELTLLQDKSINTYMFNQIINRLHNKINSKYDIIIDESTFNLL